MFLKPHRFLSIFVQMIFQKKSLGQHFLIDENIAEKIVDEFRRGVAGATESVASTIEIGAGMGVLTKYLIGAENFLPLQIIEIDKRCVEYLNEKFPQLQGKIINEDILQVHFERDFNSPIGIIGNFPYNISSQIIFKILENRNRVDLMVGMFQKEVAQRIVSKNNSKEYGIPSVLVQAFYDAEYLFEVGENSFAPPPKVKSVVIRLKRKEKKELDCDEKLFFKIVKAGFNQRRKTLRNALKSNLKIKVQNLKLWEEKVFDKRAEQLTVDEFIELTKMFQVDFHS